LSWKSPIPSCAESWSWIVFEIVLKLCEPSL
jgi:hypothetical protein